MQANESHPGKLTSPGCSTPSISSLISRSTVAIALHMQLCGLGLNPAAIITELWYCHYSIFPTLWLPLLSSGLRKECKIAFQSQEKQRFSHRAGRPSKTSAACSLQSQLSWKIILPMVWQISGKLHFLLSLILRKYLIRDCSSHIWLLSSYSCGSETIVWQNFTLSVSLIGNCRFKTNHEMLSITHKRIIIWRNQVRF